MTATYLDRILAAHREAATLDARPLTPLVDQALAMDPTRGFRAALAACDGLAIIAEVKRASPSKGLLAADLDPAHLAVAYEAGGATCLSVLTDEAFFQGSAADLRAARAGAGLPVLRKDFTVSALDVVDARLMGADAVLLILAALDDAEATEFLALARTLDLDALVEIHDEAELERAVQLGADLVGVNQRDLVTFEVDTARAMRLASQMPPGVVRVAESGISGPAEAAALYDSGYHAVLVGEALVTSGQPTAGVAALRAARPR